MQTQTGVSTGNITNKGFDARIGSNTDSFSDVFGQDAAGNYYVKKADFAAPRPDSDRTGLDGRLAALGQCDDHCQGLRARVHRRHQQAAVLPRVLRQRQRSHVYFTPVDAPLPDSWAAQIGDYSAGNPSPLVYQLVS